MNKQSNLRSFAITCYQILCNAVETSSLILCQAVASLRHQVVAAAKVRKKARAAAEVSGGERARARAKARKRARARARAKAGESHWRSKQSRTRPFRKALY